MTDSTSRKTAFGMPVPKLSDAQAEPEVASPTLKPRRVEQPTMPARPSALDSTLVSGDPVTTRTGRPHLDLELQAMRPPQPASQALDQTVRSEQPLDADLGADLGATLDMGQTLASPPPALTRATPDRPRATGRSTNLPTITPARTPDGAPEVRFEERDRYQALRTLGEGGMGEVLLVEDQDIQRHVAMKRLKGQDQGALLRFVEEVRTIGRLEHPNIVPIHDVGVDRHGDFFFIMKHIDGEPLDVIIERLDAGDPAYHARYTPTVRMQIFTDILQAVRFAHERGIIHRDLKPANIMVGQYGEVMVMDWGLARVVDQVASDTPAEAPVKLAEAMAARGQDDVDPTLTQPMRERLRLTRQGDLLGTPAYMSPEQALGDIALIDRRTDTYALAALGYELMALRHYLGDKNSLSAMLIGVIQEVPPMAYTLEHPHQAKVSAELSHFFKHGLDKDPTRRYQDAGQMLEAMQRVLSGDFAIECPVTLMKRGATTTGRLIDHHPHAVMGGAVAISLLFLTTLLYTMYGLIS